jgi:hypothetical protein
VPNNTSPPTVSGGAVEGTALTSADGTWTGTVASTTYQWQRCEFDGLFCEDVTANGTNSSYVIRNADHGHTFRLTVTKTGPYGSGTAVSAPSLVAVANAPTAIWPGGISGASSPPLQGEELTVSSASFGGTVDSRSFQWQSCNGQGTGCTDIPGATDSTYRLGLSDVGGTVRAGEVASNAGGSVAAYSPATAVVITGVPVNTTLPTISGTPLEERPLLADPGQWSGLKAQYDYQWMRCDLQGANCVDIPLASEQAHDLVTQDAGRSLRVRVTAKNVNGEGTAVSAASGAVSPSRAVNTGLPVISGWARNGDTLSASNGEWTGGLLEYGYQWQRCDALGSNCADLGGATANSYELTPSDTGSTMRVVVAATNALGTVRATSDPSEVVDPPPPTNTVPPSLDGATLEGQTLSTTAGTWTGGTPRYTYQWQRCDADGSGCADIQGADGTTYDLTSDDATHAMKVVVTATGAGGSNSAASDPTPAIDALPAAPPDPTLLGTPEFDQPLTVEASAPVGAVDPQFDYQWERCNEEDGTCEPIPDATQITYKPIAQDLGYQVRAKVKVRMVHGGIRGPVMVPWYIRPTPRTPTITGKTVVTGTREPGAPLEINPSFQDGGIGVGTDNVQVPGMPLQFIQSMPVTKQVQRVSLGPIGIAPSCQENAMIHLQVIEHPTGDLGTTPPADITAGYPAGRMIAHSTAPQLVFGTPRIVNWDIPVTTFRQGWGYSFRLEFYSGCTNVSVTSWAHNRAQVNAGPARCSLMPPSLANWDGLPRDETAQTAYRAWHVNGQADIPSGCFKHWNITGQMYNPSMPTGWLAMVSPGGYDRYISVSNPPPINGCGVKLDERGGVALNFGGKLFGAKFKTVCRWPQFADLNKQVADGWYYALPWRSRYRGAPRDMYLRLDPATVDQTAATFEPVLRFDSSEKWRPLDIASLIDEHKHAICRALSDPGACTGGKMLTSEQDFANYGGHLDLDGTYNEVIGSETQFHSPYNACHTTLDGDTIRDCDTGPRSSIYFRKVDRVDSTDPAGRQIGYTFYDYWAYYRANYWNQIDGTPLGFHVGDWEAVSIALNKSPGSKYTFDYAAFSQHGHYAAYLRHNLACEDAYVGEEPPGRGTCGPYARRVVSMVADGTHANYGIKCEESIFGDGQCGGDFVFGGIENGYDGFNKWGNANDQTALRPMPSSWEHWPGRWGESVSLAPPGNDSPTVQNSPASPGQQPVPIQCAVNGNDGVGSPCNEFAAHPKRRSQHGGRRSGPRTRFTPVKLGRGKLASPNATSYRSPAEAASSCASWAGPGVTAALCDPAELRKAAAQGTLGEPGAVTLRVDGSFSSGASAPGITQLAGRVLNDRDHLVVAGFASRSSQLSVRVADPRHARVAVARFSLRDLLPRKSTRNGPTRFGVRVRRGRGGRLSVRINGHSARSVKVESRTSKKRKHKRRRHP